MAMIPGGKRKPTKADRGAEAGRGRRVSFQQSRWSDGVTANATAPDHASRKPKLAGVGRLGRRRQDAASVGAGWVLHLLMDDQSGRTRLAPDRWRGSW